MRNSVALTGAVQRELSEHLLRRDGQEDLCFFTWRPSTGVRRATSIIDGPILPTARDREVHGNASFRPEFALRAVTEGARAGAGVGFVHSHPGGRGWQALNAVDREAEARIANIAREVTGLPLVGMTLAADGSWSARVWRGAGREVRPVACESVRVIGDGLDVTFNDAMVPAPATGATQIRTLHTWGPIIQAKVARLRVAVAGLGSVGMPLAELLARTGVERIGLFDFDAVEWVNLDRLRGAGPLDALLRRPKVEVARRVLAEASTATNPQHECYDLSICEPEGLARLLDYDLIFSCVDRPWPRHVLNNLAYADLIPVIEGGLIAFQRVDGSMRNAYWSSTVVRPGRPCLACLGQYDPALVQVERDGSLDDPSYIANLPAGSPLRRRENVAALSASVTAALMEQFLAFVVRPSGVGDYGPLRRNVRDPQVETVEDECHPVCPYQTSIGAGDRRVDPTGRHEAAERARRIQRGAPRRIRAGRAAVAVAERNWAALQLRMARRAL